MLFSHVLWDANMFFGRDLFTDQEEWFVETVRAACANDRVNWLVKLHPANVWKLRRDGVSGELGEHVAIREHVGELPPHVKLLEPETDISTWSLFDVTDVGVTIRGSVGFELPCLGKPALTAGTGFYSGRGFTVDSDTREDYLARIGRIEEIPPPDAEQVELARKHAYALFRLRQTRFTSYRSVYKPVERVDDPVRGVDRGARAVGRGARARPRTYVGSPTGRSTPATSTTSSCRSFVSIRGSSSSGSPGVARRGSVVSPAAHSSSRRSRSVVSSRLPYG